MIDRSELTKFYSPQIGYDDFLEAVRKVYSSDDFEDKVCLSIWKNLNFSALKSLEQANKSQEVIDSFLDKDPSGHSLLWTWGEVPPPREYLIEPIMPLVPVGLIAGAGGTGKSFFCLQLAASISTGADFMGFKVPATSIGRTVIFNAEDDHNEMHRRIYAFSQVYPNWFTTESISKIIVPPLEHDQDFVLHSTLRPEVSKTDEVIAYLKKIDNLKLVIFDPANMIFEGDSNSQTEVSKFFTHLYKIHNEVGCMVIVVAHNTKASSASKLNSVDDIMGSAAWGNRSRMTLGLKYNDQVVEATLTKCNYLPREDRTFRMTYVKDGSGVLQRENATASFLPENLFIQHSQKYKHIFSFIDENLNLDFQNLMKLATAQGICKKIEIEVVLDLIDKNKYPIYTTSTIDSKKYVKKVE